MTWTVMAALVTLEIASWQLGKETYCRGEWGIPSIVSTPCKTPTSPPDPYKPTPSHPSPPFTSDMQLMKCIFQHAHATFNRNILHENITTQTLLYYRLNLSLN